MRFVRERLFLASIMVAVVIAVPAGAQQNPFKEASEQFQDLRAQKQNANGANEAEAPAKPKIADADSDDIENDENRLKAFFEKMEQLLEGQTEFSLIAKEIKGDLRQEFRDNERLLLASGEGEVNNADEILKVQNRQKVIAQCIIELDTRSESSDPRARFELHRKIRDGFRDFRRKNPKLAGNQKFLLKERDLTSRAMRQVGLFGGLSQRATLADTIRRLSAVDTDAKHDESTRAHPGEQKGAIQDLRVGLRGLLKLKWVGPSLAIDREHWDEAFAGATSDDIRVKVDDLLEQRGAPANRENDARAAMLARRQTQSRSNVQRLFQELRGGDEQGSSSQGGSGQAVHMSFRNGSVNARMNTTATRFEIVVEELASPRRVLRIVDDKGALEILLVGDMVHRFVQRSNGEGLTVVEIVDDEVLSHKAKSFADFYRQNPRFVEDRFFALLDHLGFIAPASRFDPKIVHRLLEHLRMDKDLLRDQVTSLVADLDADRFTRRKAAYANLRDRLDEFYELLYEQQNDSDLSIEVRASIKKLLDASESSPASYFDGVISSLGLTDDVEYLTEVREIVDADAKRIVDARLGLLRK